MKTVHVTITGAQAAGKTHFLNKVLLPALRESGQSYRAVDGDEVVAVMTGNPPHVEVLVTNSVRKAHKHSGLLLEPEAL
jgi:adenylylsulfate kinase-like enzyme